MMAFSGVLSWCMRVLGLDGESGSFVGQFNGKSFVKRFINNKKGPGQTGVVM